MTELASTTSIRDWVDEETRHIDVVASWESLCDTYDALRFSDQLSDDERLEEYKWIVQQMNAFLTKIGTKLRSCRDVDSMVMALEESYVPSNKLASRKSLVYQKLRQQWLRTMTMRLRSMQAETNETEEEQDG